jgi:glucose-6-phosphate isomerase
MLELNFSNMLDELLGVKGLSLREIESVKSRIHEIHPQLSDRKWKELEFLDLPNRDISEVKKYAREIVGSSEYFLVFGIGGSALGPKVILEALSPFHNLGKLPRIFLYDNVDPGTLDRILSLVDLRKTTVNVISKSGTTPETAASFMILWDKMKSIFGDDAAKKFIITTDPVSGPLRQIAAESGMRTLPISAGIRGRYSVLSPVGLLLSEVIGVDSEELLKGADDMRKRCLDPELWMNPAYMFGTLLYLMNTTEKRTITVMAPYADNLKTLSEWFCQLWAESLGKLEKGMTPYPSLGATDQHSQLQLWMEGPEDKIIVFIRVENYGKDFVIPHVFQAKEDLNYLSGHTLSGLINAEEESCETALAKAGRPNMTIKIPAIDAYHLGQLFCFFEIATAFTGLLMNINPFNQPGVEAGKKYTCGIMGRKGFENQKAEVEEAREKKICWKL